LNLLDKLDKDTDVIIGGEIAGTVTGSSSTGFALAATYDALACASSVVGSGCACFHQGQQEERQQR